VAEAIVSDRQVTKQALGKHNGARQAAREMRARRRRRRVKPSALWCVTKSAQKSTTETRSEKTLIAFATSLCSCAVFASIGDTVIHRDGGTLQQLLMFQVCPEPIMSCKNTQKRNQMNFRASRPEMDKVESVVHGSFMWIVMLVCLCAVATLGQTDVQSYVVQYPDQHFSEVANPTH
jgi:hypothetical protein